MLLYISGLEWLSFFVYFATLKGFLSLFFIQYGCLVDQMCVCRLRKKSHRLNNYTHTHTVQHKVYFTGVSPLKTKCTIIKKKEYNNNNNNSFNTDILHIAHNVRPVVIRWEEAAAVLSVWCVCWGTLWVQNINRQIEMVAEFLQHDQKKSKTDFKSSKILQNSPLKFPDDSVSVHHSLLLRLQDTQFWKPTLWRYHKNNHLKLWNGDWRDVQTVFLSASSCARKGQEVVCASITIGLLFPRDEVAVASAQIINKKKQNCELWF